MNRMTWPTRVCVMAIVGAMSSVTALGQLRGPQTYDVPFGFIVGDTSCAAGEYTVSTMSPGVLKLTRKDSSKSILFLGRIESGGRAGKASTLVFRRYGDTRFLTQIHSVAEASYVQLGRSQEEREVARRWAQSQETVAAAGHP